ncbi:hypothetical protein RugamoR1_54740 [Rugamonas sp. R1(2021)]
MVALSTAVLTGCGGGGDYGAEIDVPQTPVAQPIYEYLRYPTISGLEFFNSVNPAISHLTDARGTYFGYAGGDTVTFILGDIVLFAMPGYLALPYGSLYDGAAYSDSLLRNDTAVENLMAFLMTVDDDGDYRNGIQIAPTVRIAARGLHINFNQTVAAFYSDPAVQYAVSVLSGNTLYGTRILPSPAQAQYALRTP